MSDENESSEELMKEKLKKGGLDPKRWFKIFKDELDVTTPEQLDFIDEDCYEDLVKRIEKKWEKKALRKFLGMEESKTESQNKPKDVESSLKLQRKEKKQKLKKDQELAKEMLIKLKDLETEGKDRKEHLVKEIEKGIQKKLEVSPDTWISKDKSLSELTATLEAYVDKLSGDLKDRPDSSDATVLKTASGGRALRGILISKSCKNRVKVRDKLLRVPEDVSFARPTLTQEDKFYTFVQKHQEDQFSDTIQRLGYSAAVSVEAGFKGFGIEASASYSKKSEKEERREEHSQEQYSSKVKYSFVPMASFLFEDSQLLLSQDAINDLKAIERLVDAAVSEDVLQNQCEDFFYKYGSHATKGDLHFGGIYCWRCYSHGFKQSEMKEVKTLQSQIISASVKASYGPWAIGGSFDGSWSNLSANITGTYSETLKSNTYLYVSKTGGPEEVSDLAQWKNGLVASNSTWSVIDRGIDTVPVWKIIQINHTTDFKEVKMLVEVLLTAWEQMTELKAKSVLAEVLQIEEQDAKELLKEVLAWNECKDKSNCLEHLNELLRIKSSLITSANTRAWPVLYLSQAPIQTYLKWVTQIQYDKDTDSIKILMRRLLETSDMALVKRFPGKQFVFKWLNQTDSLPYDEPPECKSLQSLQECIDKALNQLLESTALEGKTEQVQRQVTSYIAEVIRDLRTNLIHQSYDELFVITLLYPLSYDTEESFFGRLLSISDLEYLLKVLDKQITEYTRVKSEGIKMKEQSYLFLLAVSFLHSRFDHEFQSMCLEHVQYLRKNLNLNPKVESILAKSSISSSYDWAGLQQDFMEVMSMSAADAEKVYGLQLLEYLKTISATKHDIINSSHVLPTTFKTEMLDILGLSKFYPQKLTRRDALCIHDESIESKWVSILEKLLMSNHQYFECLLQNGTFIVHPVDSILALLLCADNFLRQDVINKLSTCKLAIPLLIPDPYAKIVTLPLWGMRSVIKEWKEDTGTGSTKVVECAMVEHDTPIISFMRFGDTDPDAAKTKSKLLNEVVGDSQHKYFFHCDCEGGTAKRVLMEGVVDLCWYLPAGKEAESFNKAVAFANLRGDARKHKIQRDFLGRVSFVNFVLLSQDEINVVTVKLLNQLAKAPGGLILLFSDITEESDLRSPLSLECKIIGMKRKNLAVINRKIRSLIVDSLQLNKKSHQFKTLEECSLVAKEIGIHIDEDDPDCQAGKEQAKKIFQEIHMTCGNVYNAKDEMLPLQSQEYWHMWGQHNKERHRHLHQGPMSTPDYNREMDGKKDSIRQQQLLRTDPPTPVMKLFISSLLLQQGSARDYFLQWLRFFLDRSSRKTLPPLQSLYDRYKVELQKKSVNEDERKEITQKLTHVNDKMIVASLGLEHFFRELGQIYECVMEVPIADQKHKIVMEELHTAISVLPAVAAKMLMAGYPIELMDGDAAHVPMTWVMAVLSELHELLKDAKLFVVSVLGIQSSGKSTLLNTMFGVKFAVSAGRCTRGAFIQLLPIEIENKPCGYLLVVDTEGLRAPELDAQKMLKRDNEMATFVIGLANITLINIFGETPSDMQDILQTSIHAFIRMKELDLKPSCLFVHQNVTSIAAEKKLKQGKASLVENLNEMVKYAAKEEQVQDKYSVFDQVVNFDVDKDVWYFQSLWKGSPPMAPVNPDYSDMCQNLKSALVNSPVGKAPKLTIPGFMKHVSLLWKAVLFESFVFSFKNMLEMTAYNELDAKLGQWSLKLQSDILDLQTRLENKVFSADINDLDALERELSTLVEDEVNNLQKGLLKEADDFFKSSGEHADILIQWKEHTQISLKHLCKKRQEKTDDYCRSVIRNRRERVSLDNLRSNIHQEIQEPVQQLAMKLRGKRLTRSELEREFNLLWDRLKVKVLTAKSRNPDAKVESSIEGCLKELFRDKQLLKLTQKLSVCRLKDTPTFLKVVKEIHILSPDGYLDKFVAWFKKSPKEYAKGKSAEFITMAISYLSNICEHTKDYSDSLSYKLFRKVIETVDAFNVNERHLFTEEYKIDLCLAIGADAVKKFEEMIKENAPFTILERLRQPFYITFESQYHQRSVEQTAAGSLSYYLKDPIKTAVIHSLVTKLIKDIKVRDKRFSSKYHLLFEVMMDLEKKKSFKEYSVHLGNVEQSLRDWIKVYFLEYCTSKVGSQTKLEMLAKAELKSKIDQLISVAEEVTLNCPQTLNDWLMEFHNLLSDSFQLHPEEMLENVGVVTSGKSKPDFEFFKKELLKNLEKVETEVKDTFKTLEKQMHKWKKRPYDILADEMIGCCKQCPFCDTKCEYIDPDHPGDHRVSIHRPRCLGGGRWVDTQYMTLDVCTTLVVSNVSFRGKATNNNWHPYKQYRDIYKDWMILPNSSPYDASYWKYFVARYTDDIADHFGSTVPSSGTTDYNTIQDWKKLEWDKVVVTLKSSFFDNPK